MRFLNKKYTSTHKICATTGCVRDYECNEISCYSKKADGNIGIAISGNFILENLSLDYCEQNNIEVVRSNTKYGPYGNVLSIPGKTYTMVFPLRIGVENVFTAFDMVFKGVGQTQRSNNDILIDNKKMCGMGVTKNQIVVIGSLESPPEFIKNIYSQRFLDYSNKIPPIERIGGYNDFTQTPVSLLEFLNLIKTSISSVSGMQIDEIEDVDGDNEFVPVEYLDRVKTQKWLKSTDYKSISLEELIRLKRERANNV